MQFPRMAPIDDYLSSLQVFRSKVAGKIQERLLDPTRQSVYLRADESVPFGTFATVLDRLKFAGIENVSIVTQPLEKSRK